MATGNRAASLYRSVAPTLIDLFARVAEAAVTEPRSRHRLSVAMRRVTMMLTLVHADAGPLRTLYALDGFPGLSAVVAAEDIAAFDAEGLLDSSDAHPGKPGTP